MELEFERRAATDYFEYLKLQPLTAVLKGPRVIRRLGQSRPEQDIDLYLSRPGPGSRWQDASQLVDGSGPMRICRSDLASQPLRFTERTPYNAAARLKGIFHRHSIEYGVLRMQCASRLVVQCAAGSGRGDSNGFGVVSGYGSLVGCST